MPLLHLAGRDVPLVVRRSARARRLTLSACAARERVALTLPARAALRDGLAFVEGRRDWLTAQVARWPVRTALADGASLRVHGAPVVVRHVGGRAATRLEGGALLVGGAADAAAGRALRWLRAEAQRCFDAEARRLAAGIGAAVGQVAVGDPARRWGSCSSGGRIRLSWRLVMAPRGVWQGVVAHEVAHLKHPNHGADFWALCAALSDLPPADVRAWLRAHGPALHAVG